ncbi:TRAP transporter small permease [Antarcticimicrobium luteum]|uniref:TRAP transporter small permease protein n=1 Tax=Antarcticimicrobium luteum TaxID=2547397 RepID=A0A4R5V2Y3_9RHOB|nr:TRAP transporter small permease [Antarcticimicrobium luteum]TDK46179.1 TRAP transporter small permease [Antarcticimicrobium luteum]
MHALFTGLARFMAVLGGLVLTALILLTCVSILGRSLNGILHSDFVMGIAPDLAHWLIDIGIGPVNGDFELVEAGVAFAIFAFLPLCQITAGHASVDIVANALPRGANRFLRMVTEVVFALVLILIAWKLADGMLSKKGYGETSFLLEFPVWWAYAASLFGAVVAAIVGTYMAVVRVTEFLTGRILVWDGVETDQ